MTTKCSFAEVQPETRNTVLNAQRALERTVNESEPLSSRGIRSHRRSLVGLVFVLGDSLLTLQYESDMIRPLSSFEANNATQCYKLQRYAQERLQGVFHGRIKLSKV